MFYTPWVVSEHTPDFSSMEALLLDSRFKGRTGQELALALWELMVDRELGVFHYIPARERFRKGQDVYDALQIWNCFGFTICHCHAHVLGSMGIAAGLPARIATIRGHEGTEFHYDGAWHYFDGDIQMFHRKHAPSQNEIASRQDTYEDLSLVDAQKNPSNPYMFPDRLPALMRSLYSDPPHYLPVLRESIHSMDFRLRPGETMHRYFRPKGRWVVFDNYPQLFKTFCSPKGEMGPQETGPEGPAERFWPWRSYANGFFYYSPKIGIKWQDLEQGADSMEGIDLAEDSAICNSRSGSIIFSFESPYILCGVPDPLGRVPSQLGAEIKAKFNLPEGASAKLILQSYDGRLAGSEMPWKTIWTSEGKTGELDASIDYTDLVDGLYSFKLKLELTGQGSSLKTFSNRLWFMVSPHSLPRLKKIGENRMSVHFGDRFHQPTRSFLFERRMEGAGVNPPGASSTENLIYDPASFSKLIPRDSSLPWIMTIEPKSPNGEKLEWFALFATIEGVKPGDKHDGTPFTVELSEDSGKTWEKILESEHLPHELGWHSAVFAEKRLSGKASSILLRFKGKKGLGLFRVAGHYRPERATPASGALEVEHRWFEDTPNFGRRILSQIEKLSGSGHEYCVHCSNEPHDESIILRAPSLERKPAKS